MAQAPDVRVFPDLEALSRAAAEVCVQTAQEAVRARGPFAFVLTGGATPRRLYELLAGPAGEDLPWEQTHLFWGDERYVPHDHEESNYGMARAALIDYVGVPEDQVHPMPTGRDAPEDAAAAYEEMLRRFAEARPDGAPLFDLLLLGLGADGHVASLFPEDQPHEQAEEEESWVRAPYGPPRHTPRQRLTLTFSALAEAQDTLFLVSGEKKRAAVQAVLGAEDPQKPASHVQARRRVRWMLDEAAAGDAAG